MYTDTYTHIGNANIKIKSNRSQDGKHFPIKNGWNQLLYEALWAHSFHTDPTVIEEYQ